MEKSKQIQIGLLALVALLLVLNLTGVFDGMFGGSDNTTSVREQARQQVNVNSNAAAGTATTPTPAATNSTTPAVEAPTGPTTTMTFEEETFDFGLVDEGEDVLHTYKFKNTGNEPLIIKDAKGSCGCTVPSWPKEPILPGESGEIDVKFASKGKSGKQSKRVTITANTNPAQSFLTITGEVNKKADAAVAKPVQ